MIGRPQTISRRTMIGGMGGAFAFSSLFAAPRRGFADDEHAPGNPFILLLHGVYEPVPAGEGPAHNLGLTTVDLNSGFYSKTKIYPVFGVDGANDQKKPVGTFYPEALLIGGEITFTPPTNPGFLAAYDLPGGALAMQFLSPPAGAPAGYDDFVVSSDGAGGFYLTGTFELSVLEATGVYRPFQGGHNHMVDRLHQLADGSFDEFCFCNISQYQFP